MKLSLKSRILKYIRNSEGWVNGGEIEKLAESVNFKASNGSRRCRELCNEGLLERKIEKSLNSRVASVWYKATEPKEVIRYFLPSENRHIVRKIW